VDKRANGRRSGVVDTSTKKTVESQTHGLDLPADPRSLVPQAQADQSPSGSVVCPTSMR
jgi:hypothetical protein